MIHRCSASGGIAAALVALLSCAALPANATLIDFTPGFGFSTSPVLYQGVTFSEAGGGSGTPGLEADLAVWGLYFPNIPGASLGFALNDSHGASNIGIDFNEDVSDINFLLSTGTATTWTVTAFSSANSNLGSITATNPGGQQAVLASLPFTGVRRITITDPENSFITVLDDLRFTATAPEPGSLALLGMSVLPVVGMIRRRAR